MEPLDKAIAFLHDLDRPDLTGLLRFSTYRLLSIAVGPATSVPGAEILSPQIFT
jgi:hypothetical protein